MLASGSLCTFYHERTLHAAEQQRLRSASASPQRQQCPEFQVYCILVVEGLAYVSGTESNICVHDTDKWDNPDLPTLVDSFEGGHTDWITCLCVGRNAKRDHLYLFSGSDDTMVLQWDITEPGSKLYGAFVCFRGHRAPVRDMIVHENDWRLYSASDDFSVKIWDLATSRCIGTISRHVGPMQSIEIVGRLLVTCSLDASISICSTEENKCSAELSSHTEDVRLLQLTGAQHLVSFGYDMRINLWALKTGKLLRTVTQLQSQILCVASTKGSKAEQLFVGLADGKVQCFDMLIESEEPTLTFEGHALPVSCVAVDTQRKLVFSGSYDRTIRTWSFSPNDLESPLRNVYTGHSHFVTHLLVQDNMLVSGSQDRLIKVWEIGIPDRQHPHYQNCKYNLEGHKGPINCMVAQEMTLYSGSADRSIRAWNLLTGECQLCLVGHLGEVCCLMVRGPWLFSGGSEGTICLWARGTGECGRVIDAHHDLVSQLEWLSELNCLISTGYDKTIKIWH
jgi:WD40 repeat protein